MADPATQGILYIVSTPIGNLGDITYRAVETLRQADLVAAEDTRRTSILLRHYGVNTPLTSYHSYNQIAKGRELIGRLKEGGQVALVSDAGTPGISDPLFQLARHAVAEGIDVRPIPGASALTAALTVSGLPVDRFVFEGFLPRKKRRKSHIAELARESRTLVLFESPHRMGKTLADLHAAFGDRPVTVAREMTKLHEEITRSSLGRLTGDPQKQWRGEITLVIAGCPEHETRES